MNSQEKRDLFKHRLKGMFREVEAQLEKKADKIMSSGAIDMDEWDPNENNPMLLPKAFMVAFLRDEANQFTADGTSFEKQVRSDAKNIGYHL
jgi:hypothetical protein